jgi:type IV pilus assembly protein PilX
MSATLQRQRPNAPTRERGYILVTGLLFLVVLTLLGIALFRATGLMERISANTRDKERSFEAAQSALQYAEWWIAAGNGGSGGPCTAGLVNGNTYANVNVCSNALATPAATPWANGYTYVPTNLTVVAGGGMVGGSSKDVNYSAAPTFYIERLGTPDGKTQLYQVTAAGFGGITNTTTVVRSTYQVTPAVKQLDGL